MIMLFAYLVFVALMLNPAVMNVLEDNNLWAFFVGLLSMLTVMVFSRLLRG